MFAYLGTLTDLSRSCKSLDRVLPLSQLFYNVTPFATSHKIHFTISLAISSLSGVWCGSEQSLPLLQFCPERRLSSPFPLSTHSNSMALLLFTPLHPTLSSVCLLLWWSSWAPHPSTSILSVTRSGLSISCWGYFSTAVYSLPLLPATPVLWDIHWPPYNQM